MKMLTTEQHQTIFTKPESNQGRKSTMDAQVSYTQKMRVNIKVKLKTKFTNLNLVI